MNDLKLKKRKATVLEKLLVAVTLPAGLFLLLGVIISSIQRGAILAPGKPSAVLLGIYFLLPTIEVVRYQRIVPFGMSFRAILLTTADFLLFNEMTFASVYWEIAAVAISLLIVFYMPNIRRRKKE